jgi:hypothetical protein
MMVEENWFERPEWSGPEVLAGRDRAAAAGWERVRWLVGCGAQDHAARQSSARVFHARLGRRLEVDPFFEYTGKHVPPQGADMARVADVLRRWVATEAALSSRAVG